MPNYLSEFIESMFDGFTIISSTKTL